MRHGCTNQSSHNFDYYANVDDHHSCNSPARSYLFTFGEVYQTCSKTTQDPKDPICPQLLQKTLTGDYSCPGGYRAVELNTVIPIKRPPFIQMPAEASSGLTVALFTTSGNLWLRDDKAAQQWKEIHPDSKEFVQQILTDTGLVNTTDFASMDPASKSPIDPASPGGGADPSHAEGLSPGAAAGIGIGSLFLGAVVALVIMLGIKLGYCAKKKPAASLGGKV